MSYTTLKESNFDLSLDKRGFYHLYVHEGEEFNTDDFKKVAHYVQSSCKGMKAPFLVEFGYGCTFAEGVEEHLSTWPERFSTADALVIKTYAHKLISKYYMRNFEPTIPTEIFDTNEEALKWIQQHLD